MMLVKCYAAPSDIHGLGVFAAQHIARGEVVWQLRAGFDLVISAEEVSTWPEHIQHFAAVYGYPHLEIPGHVVIDMDEGRFMNHTLSPNTDFTQFDRGIAIADIAPGEEITCNYFEFDPTFTGFAAAPVKGTAALANGRYVETPGA